MRPMKFTYLFIYFLLPKSLFFLKVTLPSYIYFKSYKTWTDSWTLKERSGKDILHKLVRLVLRITLHLRAGHSGIMPIIPFTQEAEIGRIIVGGQPGKK
jgi:hypothetical protein